ncbi:hypothetical protein ACFTAO_37435 [Paenibacillus rhizoplanae]
MNTQRFQQVLPVLLLVFSLAVLPGCWSSKELNELAVVMALGIDTAPQGYAVSAQVLNSGEARNNKGESGKSLPVLTYKATGQTVPDALQHILSAAPHALYLSHIRVLVLGGKSWPGKGSVTLWTSLHGTISSAVISSWWLRSTPWPQIFWRLTRRLSRFPPIRSTLPFWSPTKKLGGYRQHHLAAIHS